MYRDGSRDQGKDSGAPAAEVQDLESVGPVEHLAPALSAPVSPVPVWSGPLGRRVRLDPKDLGRVARSTCASYLGPPNIILANQYQLVGSLESLSILGRELDQWRYMPSPHRHLSLSGAITILGERHARCSVP